MKTFQLVARVHLIHQTRAEDLDKHYDKIYLLDLRLAVVSTHCRKWLLVPATEKAYHFALSGHKLISGHLESTLPGQLTLTMKLTSASLACLFVVGPIGSLAKKPVAPELADYCFYAINTVLGSYTFYDPSSSTTSSISTTTSIEPRDSSSSSSSGHGNGLSVRGSSSTTFCTDTIQVTSLYASARLYCNYKEWKATIPYWESLCKADGVTLMDLTSIEAEVTKAYAKTLPAIDPETNLTTTTGNITSPVRLTRSYYERAHKTYVSCIIVHTRS